MKLTFLIFFFRIKRVYEKNKKFQIVIKIKKNNKRKILTKFIKKNIRFELNNCEIINNLL